MLNRNFSNEPASHVHHLKLLQLFDCRKLSTTNTCLSRELCIYSENRTKCCFSHKLSLLDFKIQKVFTLVSNTGFRNVASVSSISPFFELGRNKKLRWMPRIARVHLSLVHGQRYRITTNLEQISYIAVLLRSMISWRCSNFLQVREVW